MHTFHRALIAVTRLCIALALVLAPWANSLAASAVAAPPVDSVAPVAVVAPRANSITPDAVAAPEDVATVNLGNGTFSYSPVIKTVLVNDTVEWVWTGDGFSHSTTSGSCSGLTCTPDGNWTSVLTFTSGFTFTHTFTQTGTYAYYCTNHGPDPFDMRGTIQVVDNLPITGLSATNSSPTPLGGVTGFTATISAGNSVTYTWSFGDGFGAAGALTSHTYGAAGYYTAAVTATNPVSTVIAFTPVTITRSIFLPLVQR